jgi:5,6-dimethylbenzimidazole synthase
MLKNENKKFLPEDQKILESIMIHRRDVRGNRFLDKPLSGEIVDRLLQAAVLAPSVGYSQPWEFVVIRDDATKRQIADSFRCETGKAAALFKGEKRAQYVSLKLEGILEAPVNIAVFYKPSPGPVLGQTTVDEVGEYSVVCAVQNMWLMARAMNIGKGWVSILDPVAVGKILGAPEQNKLIAYLCVGHVREFLDKPELELIAWEKRKALDSIVYNECYS